MNQFMIDIYQKNSGIGRVLLLKASRILLKSIIQKTFFGRSWSYQSSIEGKVKG
jgi:hypothetical protein